MHQNSLSHPASFKHGQRGQALLIIVLIMVVSLTVGLSLALRSITAVRVATEEDNSQRAFSAAEAGIERVLKSNTAITSPVSLQNNSSIDSVSVSPIAPLASRTFLRNGAIIEKDDAADVWILQHNADDTLNFTQLYAPAGNGSIRVYWGDASGACNNAAMEVILMYGSTSAPSTKRFITDPCSGRSNNVVSPPLGSVTVNGITLPYGMAMNNVGNGILLKVIPLYASTRIAVDADPGLWPQGRILTSTGSSGGTVRKVTFYKGYPELPAEFFQYILFSTHP